MSLTPEDVKNKQFTTVRFKEGYDLDEVDNFLDDIESAMTALVKEKNDLAATSRGEVPDSVKNEISELSAKSDELASNNAALTRQVDELQGALAQAQNQVQVTADNADNDELANILNAELNEAREELAAAQSDKAALAGEVERLNTAVAELTASNSELASRPAASIDAAAPADGASSSLRVLELAQRTADEAVASARIEAEELRNFVSNEVAQLRSEAGTEAENLLSQAQATVASITRDFETTRAGLERRVEELRAYEKEYRSRLRTYLEGQLRELESKNLSGDREVTGE